MLWTLIVLLVLFWSLGFAFDVAGGIIHVLLVIAGVSLRGHSIECRINAENPRTFAPSPGLITAMNIPGGPGVRIDTAAYPGWFVPPHYDSLIAKLIVHHRTRDMAIARMQRALEAMIVEGVDTTVSLQQQVLADPDFIAGNISTRFMERFSNPRPVTQGAAE